MEGSRAERLCKPSSVRAFRRGAIIHLGRRLPATSLRPTRESNEADHLSSPIRPCSGRGLPCRFRRRKRGELLPHHFTLTRRNRAGGILSVALSVRSPSLGVTQHPVLWSSDFPHSPTALQTDGGRRDRPSRSAESGSINRSLPRLASGDAEVRSAVPAPRNGPRYELLSSQTRIAPQFSQWRTRSLRRTLFLCCGGNWRKQEPHDSLRTAATRGPRVLRPRS